GNRRVMREVIKRPGAASAASAAQVVARPARRRWGRRLCGFRRGDGRGFRRGGRADGRGRPAVGGRLDLGPVAVVARHLAGLDDNRLRAGTDAAIQSGDDVMVKEHHGATTSSRSGGSLNGSRFDHVSPRYVMYQLSTYDQSTDQLLKAHLSGYHRM